MSRRLDRSPRRSSRNRPARPRSSSMLPGVISLAAAVLMNGAGSVFSILAIAPFGDGVAVACRPSERCRAARTGTPALATWAAIAAAHHAGADDRDLAGSRTSDAPPGWWRCPGRRRCIGSPARSAALALQQRRRLAGDARAGGAQRMAERDRAAVDIDPGQVDAEVAAMQASDWAAKASFSSTTSMSAIVEPGALQRLAASPAPGRCP